MKKYILLIVLVVSLFCQETSPNFEEELLLFGDDLLLPDEPQATMVPALPQTAAGMQQPSNTLAAPTSPKSTDNLLTTTPSVATSSSISPQTKPAPIVLVDTTPPTIVFDNTIQSTEKSIAINDNSSAYRSPKKALFLSLLVPGLGQGYVKRYWKTGLFGAIEIGAIVGAIVMNNKGDDIQAEAHDYADTYFDADNLTNFYEKLYTWGTKHEWYQDTTHNLNYTMFYGGYLNDTTPNGMMGYEKYVAVVEKSPYKYAGDYTQATQGWSDMTSSYNKDTADYKGFITGIEQNFYLPTSYANDPNASAVYELDGTPAVSSESATFLRLINTDKSSNPSGSRGHGYSKQQHHYNDLISESQDAYKGSTAFIIALVVNHIASATDALLSARRYNRELLQEIEEAPKDPSQMSNLLDQVTIHNDLAYNGQSGVTTTVGLTWHF